MHSDHLAVKASKTALPPAAYSIEVIESWLSDHAVHLASFPGFKEAVC